MHKDFIFLKIFKYSIDKINSREIAFFMKKVRRAQLTLRTLSQTK